MPTPPRSRRSTRPADRHRSDRPTVTIVVPAKNEAANLRQVLPDLPAAHEVIVVDGHSEDDTRAVVAEVRPDARFVQQTRRGKGNALACGLQAATGDVVVLFDADGSADPAEIDRFVAVLTDGTVDMAKGSREVPGGGSADLTPLRRLGNRMLTALMNRLFGTRFTDLCYGYNALWRDVVPQLDLPPVDRPDSGSNGGSVRGDGFEIEAMLHCRVASAGLTVAEVPSHERLRIHGDSNLSVVRDGLRVLRVIIAEWRMDRAEWRMDRAEWRMDRAEWRMDRAEWRSDRARPAVPESESESESESAAAQVADLSVQRRLHETEARTPAGADRPEREELLDAAG